MSRFRLQLYHTLGSAPPPELDIAELAFSEANRRLYVGLSDGQIYTFPFGEGGNGDTTSLVFSAIASTNLSALRCVVESSGQLVYADPSNPEHARRTTGLLKASVSSGNLGEFTLNGVVTDAGWNWDTSKPVWLGALGTLTQVFPTTGYSRVIGTPISSQTLFFEPQEAIFLGTSGGGDTAPGPQPAEGGNVFVMEAIASTDLSALRCVIDENGQFFYANPADLAHAGRMAGLLKSATSLGNLGVAYLQTLVTDAGWNWDTSKPVWLGPLGTLTQVIPTTGYSRVIATPISSNTLFFEPQEAILL